MKKKKEMVDCEKRKLIGTTYYLNYYHKCGSFTGLLDRKGISLKEAEKLGYKPCEVCFPRKKKKEE